MRVEPDRLPSTDVESLDAVLPPEARLVLLAARGPDADDQMRALLAAPLDWPRVVWLAQVERTLPTFWNRLRAVSAGPLPDGAAQLGRVAMVTEFRLESARRRLEELAVACAHEGLPLLLLKGTALALTAYRSFADRAMIDLDVLVPREHATRAWELAQSVGWAPDDEAPGDEHAYEGHHHLPPLVDRSVSGLTLEIHTDLFFSGHPFRFTGEDVLARARPVRVGAVDALAPSAEDMLLHTCLHFGWSHMMLSAAWRTFRDVRVLAEADAVDWDAFVERAMESRGGSSAFWTLRLARGLVGAPVPSAVLDSLRPALPASVIRRLDVHYTRNLFELVAACPSLRLGYFLWRVGVMPERSGHGRVRPWDRASEFVSPEQAGSRGARKIREYARNAPSWARYGVRLLAG